MINIRQCDNEDVNWIKNLIIRDKDINEIFKYSNNRLASASIITLIYDDDIPIGFIYVAHEFPDERIGFVDMGIVSSRRGYGYGEIAMNIFLDKIKNIDMFLIAETKENNVVANRSLNKYEHIYDKDDLSFYLLNRNLEELKNEGLYDKLIDHINSERLSSKDLVKNLY